MLTIIGAEAQPGLRINRTFALLWSGHALSVLGDVIFAITLIVWIAAELAPGRSWSPLAVSGLLLASAVPVLVIGPVAGVLVDRWRDKRRVMLRASAESYGVLGAAQGAGMLVGSIAAAALAARIAPAPGSFA